MPEGTRWPGIVIFVLEYYPPSKGARVMVFHQEGGRYRHITSSASGEGWTLSNLDIQRALEWAKEFYEGAPVRHIDREEACRMFPEKPSRPGRRRTRKTEDD